MIYRNRWSIGVCVLLVVSAMSTSSQALVISTYDNLGDGFASGNGADTYINENGPSGTYGTSGVTFVRNQTGVRHESSYYRFDLSAIDKANATGARLRIYDQRFGGLGTLPGSTFEIWALDNEAADAWGETNISWNSAPGHTDDGTPYNGPDFNGDATLLGSFTYVREGSSPWSTPISVSGLLDRVKTDTNDLLTVMVVGPAGNATAFRTGTKESSVVSIWDGSAIPSGSAAAQLLVDQPTVVVSTFDHDGDGLASGTGADTWITESGKGSNYGGGVDMKMRNNTGGQQELVYVRFDLSAIDKPEVGDAQLQLYDRRFNEGGFMNGKAFAVWALDDGAEDNWDENAITWNDAPGHADDGNPFDDPDFNANVTYLGDLDFSYQTPGNGWGLPVEIAGLAELVAADTNGQLTLMITGPAGMGSLFYVGTKESWHDRFRYDQVELPLGTVAPRLLVTRAPEPSTVALCLLGFGSLLIGLGRRRDRATKRV